MASHEKNSPITPPLPNPKRELGRTVAESLVELVPGGNMLTEIWRITHPPKSESDTQSWHEAITTRSNEHDRRLDHHNEMLMPTETVTGLPAQLVVKLLAECPDGLGEKHYQPTELCAFFPEENLAAIEDAVFDLKTLGLLRSRDWIGGWSVALEEYAYEKLDGQIMGWETNADAIEIARLMLSENDGHAPNLHTKTGWSLRRFNPAFRLLLPIFPDGRIRELPSQYVALGVLLDGEDRAKLRRLIAKAARAVEAP